MNALLLACGSRALCATEASVAWSRELLGNAIGVDRWFTVLHGGARGPDTWAGDIARERGVYVLVMRASLFTSPLRRNDAMVDVAVDRAAAGWKVAVLALRASWSATRGTAYTAQRARTAGLQVVERTCPRAYGPLEVRDG